ncbi:MAG: DUF1572 domain-containing protein [Acidobacteria bacterium]|nr:MAG: DUF1572 domain-containing protein [Acidobacteriota bacterium]
MSDPLASHLLEEIRGSFRSLRSQAERALDQIDDDAFLAPFGDGNSPALLVKHVAGNLRSRFTDFLTTDGEKPDRDRESEFVLAPEDDRPSLEARWREGWACLEGALAALAPADLERTVLIRYQPHTVLRALQRALTHVAYHVGQIVQLCRHRCRGRWQSLSIPRGESDAFNETMRRRFGPQTAGE